MFCKTRLVSSVDTTKGGEDDCEEASESGLQLPLGLSEVCRIDAQGVSAIRANTKALFEPNYERLTKTKLELRKLRHQA